LWAGDAEVLAVILINLLPHREEKRKQRKAAFFLGLAMAAGLGLAVVGLWFFVLSQFISAQQGRNGLLASEIAKLEEKIKDIASLQAEINGLKARQKAVEDLQTDRNMPVNVLNELVKRTPEGVYFNSLKQDGAVLTVAGIAQTNERVSELLRNTSTDSEWLTRPDLVEIKAINAAAGSKDQKRLFDFSMRISIKPPAEAASAIAISVPAVAASGVVGAASAAAVSAAASVPSKTASAVTPAASAVALKKP
jgi:type IV pilus assembly protein PilN